VLLEVSVTVTPFQPFSASGGLCHRSPATPGASANCGKVFQSQDAAITIFTAEGDKVTLSASSQTQFEFATYDANGFLGRYRSAETSQSLSVSVEGNLSRQELKDIRKAIKTIGRAADELTEGDVDGATRQVEKLQKLDTLSQVQAQVEVKREISLGTFAVAECPASPVPEQPAVSAPEQPKVSPGAIAVAECPAQQPASAAGTTPSESFLHKLIEGCGKDRRSDSGCETA
jgi:hypothetical protein